MRTLSITALIFSAALTACATGRARVGDIHLKPYGNLNPAHSYTVQRGRVLGPDVDVSLDEEGCIRGEVHGANVFVCSKDPRPASPRVQGARTEHWAGPTGFFTVEVDESGHSLRVDGQQNGQPLNTTLLLGDGPSWDELRRHPALLALAAAAAGVTGEPDDEARRVVGQ